MINKIKKCKIFNDYNNTKVTQKKKTLKYTYSY